MLVYFVRMNANQFIQYTPTYAQYTVRTVYVCMHVYISVCIHRFMDVCMYVQTVCMYICGKVDNLFNR